MSYISAITKGDNVLIWERDEHGRNEISHKAPFYFYVEDQDGKYTTIFGDKVSKIEFDNGREFYSAKKRFESQGIKMFESDIPPELRMISNIYYGQPAPKLNTTFFDIEVDYDPSIGFSTIANPYAPINSIALFHQWNNTLIVITVPPSSDWTMERLEREVNASVPIPSKYNTKFIMCNDEKELLINFIAEIEDSDIVCGWNSDYFDWPYLAKRIVKRLGDKALQHLSFPGANMPALREIERYGRPTEVLDLSGRLTADYMMLYQKYEPGEKASFKLEFIADEVLVDDNDQPILPKLKYQGNLADLYRNNYAFFTRYNIRDVEILDGFEQRLAYVELANQMYHLSGGLFKHVIGTLKLAEYATINYCHHVLKRVVPDCKPPSIDRPIAGALVLLPQIGLHEWTGSIDINSLYPNSIRAINISPETLRGQFQEDIRAAEEIAKNSFIELTLDFENGETITKTATEWKQWLKNKKWAISGYGTVFDQNEPGIIPTILAEWYTSRKKYQALMKEAIKEGDEQKAAYYDRIQYVYKIKLNSYYGALTNLYFRFFDLRLGESTTGTGRMILKHQCRKVSEILDGQYNIDFPLYETIKDTEEHNAPIETALHGQRFKGQFMSESVLYGDTDSTYFKTHAVNKEDAVKIADGVAARVNSSYPKFMQDAFLCNSGYDELIKAGREIVSDRGIFVDKKRYILHIVDKEGKAPKKKKEEMKVMGLDTKKTTLPKHIADKLNEFIERYLKGEDWDTIAQGIVEYKDALLNTDNILDIGLPKGIKGVEDYTKEFLRQGNDTRLPGHVAAAIHYNQCLETYNDKGSVPITSGMKIKVFYLNKKYGKFKSIAIPTDTQEAPRWFTENFTVDYDAHIERLVDNPLQNILNAIGKKTPTKQDLLVNSLFEF